MVNPRMALCETSVTVLMLICLYAVAPARAAQERTNGTTPIGSLPTYSTYGFSADGEWLAYIVRDEGAKDESGKKARKSWVGESYFGDIWIANLRTGENRKLTERLGLSWFPKWSPDGHLVAFLSERVSSGDARLWLWDSTRNELRKVSDEKIESGWGIPLEWTPDSRSVLVTAIPTGSSSDVPLESKHSGSPGRKIVPDKPRKGDEAKWSAVLHDKNQLRDLLRIDITTGRATKVVRGQIVATHMVSPDGLHLAYSVVRRYNKSGLIFDLAVVNLTMMRQRAVVAKGIPLNNTDGHFAWSPDSTFLAYRRSEFVNKSDGELDEAAEVTTHDDCYVVNVNSGSPHNISHLPISQRYTAGFSKQCWWDDSGSRLYFVFNGVLWRASINQETAEPLAEIPDHHLIWWGFPETPEALEFVDGANSILAVARRNDGTKQEDLYKINLTNGQTTRLLARLKGGQVMWHMYDPYVVAPDGRQVAYVAEDASQHLDLWMSDTGFKAPRRLTQLNSPQ